jgi:subtilisin family serine protease
VHEVVVVLAPMSSGTDRRGLAVSSLGPRLREMIADGRAEKVFQAPGRRFSASVSSLPSIFTVKTRGDDETRDVLESLQAEADEDSLVYVAPPRHPLQRRAGANMGTSGGGIDHWGMHYIGIDSCHVDASHIRIAVVDTGVDRTHPDLAAAIDDYINFCQDESEEDIEGHGTHVCGILAAGGQRPGGMLGACNARLIVLKGLGQKYSATEYYRALGEAVQRAQIVNLSLGGNSHDPGEALIIQQAVDAGVLVVAASGNDDDDGSYPCYPANLTGVLAVGAIDHSGSKADFSNAGPHVAVVAPGVDIWSTVPTKPSGIFKKTTHYAPCSGTSMATPFVAAMAARIAAANPGTPFAIWIRDKLPIDRCPGQTCKTDDLGVGFIKWGGTLEFGNA